MRVPTWSAILLASALMAFGPAFAADLDCHSTLVPSTASNNPLRKIEANDLVGLRDIGPSGESLYGRSPLAVSPDGHQIAFEMHRADVASNGYCVGLFVIDMARGNRLRPVNVGGEFVPWVQTFRGVVGRPLGSSAILTPRWSPDGQWLAFLRRDNGVTQIWRVRPDGSGIGEVTHDRVDVIGFDWSADGRHILYSDQPGIIDAQAALDRQGRTGYPFGPDFEPMIRNRPFVTGPLDMVLHSVDIMTGETTLASVPEQHSPAARTAMQGALSAMVEDTTKDGRRAWTAQRDVNHPFGAVALHAELPEGGTAFCNAETCDGIVEALWSGDGRTLFYLRREGWGNSQYALYAWSPGGGSPRRSFVTDGWIGGCVLAGLRLLCLTETSDAPRRIVSLDPLSGNMASLFDPNPEFRRLMLGPVTRLYWKTVQGSEAFGDLVLPPDYRKGDQLPLIVVQYQSRGFLRGGTGDEYPIQLFAARGYAVLSVNRPLPVGMQAARSDEELGRIGLQGWTDRHNVMSSIDAGLDAAERLGVVDPWRVGITGLSDGGTSVDFALVNSNRFAAAETSSCCMSDSSFLAYLNQQASDHFRMEGYPGIADDGREFWKPISLLLNARKIDTPILMQLSDEEYLDAVQAYEGLRELKKPVDMLVYPDEHHFKWQPSHRDAVYRRSVAWFDFWLKGTEDPGLVDPTDYDRWRHLRQERDAGAAGPAAQVHE